MARRDIRAAADDVRRSRRRAPAREGRADTDAERARGLQRMLWDGGFAGITLPEGVRRPGPHRRAPPRVHRGGGAATTCRLRLNVRLTLGIIGPTLLELGTDEQKARYLPGMIRGDELWVQFLSEPTGGSDLAGAVTRADARRRRVGAQRLEDLEPARPTTPTTACAWPAPTGTCPSTAASRCSSCRSRHPGVEVDPDRAGQRRDRVLPGVLRRRRRPRRATSSAT